MPSSVYEDTFLTLAPTFKAYYSTVFARYRKMTIKEAKNKLNCHCPGQTIYCNQPISLLECSLPAQSESKPLPAGDVWWRAYLTRSGAQTILHIQEQSFPGHFVKVSTFPFIRFQSTDILYRQLSRTKNNLCSGLSTPKLQFSRLWTFQ